MNTLQEFLNHPLVIKWGCVLLHFLWQGAILSMIAWIVLSLCARRSASLRYLLATGCLFLMVSCPLITWMCLGQLDHSSMPAARVPSSGISLPADNPPFALFASQEGEPLAEVSEKNDVSTSTLIRTGSAKPYWSTCLESCLPWFVAAWACGVFVLSVRLTGGWIVARKSVETGHPLRASWTARVQQLTMLLDLSRPVRWVESNRILVPQAMGWLKPVVLVPASLFTTLSPDEIECLILHELIHIQRHDFLLNLMQCVIETLFFYHPGVYWLSRRIRLERELACDAAVVSFTNDRFTFSRALLSLAEQAQLPAPALAAADGDLTTRIRAVLGLKQSLSGSGFLFGLCLTVCIMTVGFVSSVNSQTQKTPQRETVSSMPAQNSAPVIERFVEDGIPVPELSGTVVDIEGATVAGATVYLRQNNRSRSGRGIPRPWEDLARTTTDAEGTFQFLGVLDAEQHRVFPAYDLVVLKPGYAPGWKHLLPIRPVSDIRLTLQPPTTVTGRVTDTAGKPVGNAEIRLKHLMSIRHITQADLEEGRWPSWKDRQFVALDGFRDAPVSTTDLAGRFELKGLPANRGLVLQVSHPDHLIREIYAATVPKLPPETAAKAKREVQAGEISVSLDPGYRLQLRIVDDETGALIPGVRCANSQGSYHIHSRQRDQDGVIEINHLTKPHFFATVNPPTDSEYLAYSELFEWSAETRLKEVEIRLKKGIPVSGRVISRETGAGVEGAQVFVRRIQQEVLSETLSLHTPRPVTTNADGNFLFHCPPGEFAFHTWGRNRGFKSTASPQMSRQKVFVTPEGPDNEPIIALESAPRFRLTVKDPRGKQVADAEILAQAKSSRNSDLPVHGITNAEGKYLLDQLFMSDSPLEKIQPNEVIIRNADNTLGARLLLQRPPENGPLEQRLEVTLQKLGFVEGRTVHEQTGQPIAGTQIILYRQHHGLNLSTPVKEITTTGADGYFRLKGVLPGIEHHLSMTHTRYKTPNGYHLRFKVTEGTTKDFGKVILSDLTPPAEPEKIPVNANERPSQEE
tara:strand:+ start:2045 stop:5131 length:3087 start_codon:yes stop_codon:yes gene_type:complete